MPTHFVLESFLIFRHGSTLCVPPLCPTLFSWALCWNHGKKFNVLLGHEKFSRFSFNLNKQFSLITQSVSEIPAKFENCFHGKIPRLIFLVAYPSQPNSILIMFET